MDETDWAGNYQHSENSLVAQMGESACNAGEPGSTPGLGRCPAEGNAYPSHILAWWIPWTGEPDRLQSMRSQRVGHDWGTNSFTPPPLYFRNLHNLCSKCGNASTPVFNIKAFTELPTLTCFFPWFKDLTLTFVTNFCLLNSHQKSYFLCIILSF